MHVKFKATQLLEAKGILATRQRLEIAQIMFAKMQHLSAEDVFARLAHSGHDSVSKATVYNTLSLFAQQGLVREVVVDPNKVFYDSNPKVHHHFYNLDTGELLDIEQDVVDMSTIPALPEGTEGIDVIIRIRQK